ncbi:hypothetical protein TSUD_29330 [Trifolium subterraneum]|uniref:Exocyst subunit Exo70 family protein n=1 Tax=Trifolium subterraneum TaxID=3900 RepID=A0A2Z6NDG5_TRISU|nr:hypothetical protein TSUD_29330 [Trifolium subterraneum]
MYTAITVLLPEIELIFSFNSTSGIKSQAYDSKNRLMESVRNIFSEFEYAILKDSSKSVANFGGVHSLTKQTMQYLTSLADYSNVLSEIFLDVPPSSKFPLSESYLSSPELSNNVTENATRFSVQMMRLILSLLCKIDVKSKQCKNVSLSYLFLANNLRHIVEKVQGSKLKYILGDDWLLKHMAKVKQFMENYEREAWGEVLSSLPENPTAALSVAEAREVFMKFNLELEKAYRKQSAFVVPESKFCEEIKASLARKIVPIYRELYDRHYIMAGNHGEMKEYVKFIPEDVQNYLVNLFCGIIA